MLMPRACFVTSGVWSQAGGPGGRSSTHLFTRYFDRMSSSDSVRATSRPIRAQEGEKKNDFANKIHNSGGYDSGPRPNWRSHDRIGMQLQHRLSKGDFRLMIVGENLR